MKDTRPKITASNELVVVDGAGGFLGSHVVEMLRRGGWRVRATDLPSTDLSHAGAAGAETVPCDLLDRDGVDEVVRGAGIVVHIAGLFDYSLPPEALRKANVEATRNACDAALKAGVSRFIHLSSIAVYGRPRTVPIGEDHPRTPNNPYSRSKIEGEAIALEAHKRHGLPVVSVRPAGIYGPRSRYGQAPLFAFMAMLRAKGRRRIPAIAGGPKMHHVHVEDVASAIRLLMTAPADLGGAYNVADDTPLTQGVLLGAIMEAIGLERSFRVPYPTRIGWPFIRMLLALPDTAFRSMNARFAAVWREIVEAEGLAPTLSPKIDRDFLGYMNADYVLDTSRIKALGFAPKYPSTIEGIARTIDWYRDQRWLP
ncbi:NAD-dependent epimerase/dehydratase family protein [Thermodesulfobacteriota bacterium]